MVLEKKILEQIASKDRKMLNSIYTSYRNGFVRWVLRNYKIEEAEALDFFQEAVVILYQNVQKGTIKESKVSVKTYLYGVSKHLIIDKHKSKRFENNTAVELQDHFSISEGYYSTLKLDDDQMRLKKALTKIGERCRKLIELAFYRNFDSESIAHEMNFSNADVVKTTKMRCIKKLKDLMLIE